MQRRDKHDLQQMVSCVHDRGLFGQISRTLALGSRTLRCPVRLSAERGRHSLSVAATERGERLALAQTGFISTVRTVAARVESRWAPRSTEERNIRALYVNGAMLGVSGAGIITYLPVFLARSGASAGEIGLLTSAPAFASMLVFIPAGLFAERFSNQVRLRVWSSLLMRIPYPILVLSIFIVDRSHTPIVAITLWTLRARTACDGLC